MLTRPYGGGNDGDIVRTLRLFPLVLVVLASVPAIAQSPATTTADPLARYVYPLSKARRVPRVTIDVTDTPELKPWAEKARKVVQAWYPTITQLLATEHYKPFRRIKLTFKKEISAPAWASNGEITVNGKWVTAHPDDLGMMVHELTHVIQEYPENKADTGWLVEGIADYIRWWRYEPEAPRTRVNPAKASYKDAYRVTAAFLAWTGEKYDRRLVPALDRALRKAEDPLPVFVTLTGKDVDTIWAEYIATLPK